MRWFAASLLLALGLFGVWHLTLSRRLEDYVNAKWVPVTTDQQRQTAIDGAFAALKTMPSPNISAGAAVKVLEPIAIDHLKDKGVTKLTFETDRQLLKAVANFDTIIKPEDVDPKAKDWVAKLQPRVSGQAELFLSATAAIATSPKRVLQVKLLPAVQSIRVTKVTLVDRYEISAAGSLLADILSAYADNLSGTLARLPMLQIELPASMQDQFDLSGPIKVGPTTAESAIKLSLSAKPIAAPYELRAAAILIDAGNILALAQVSPIGEIQSPTTAANTGFSEMSALFKERLSSSLDLKDFPTGAWIAISKELLSNTINGAFAQAQACLNGSATLSQSFAEKIPTPDSKSIDCTPRMDCTPNSACDLHVDRRECGGPPSCSHNRDRRDCSGWDKLICEGAKAVQNAAYDTAFEACKKSCELAKGVQNGLYATQKAQCEANKSKEKLECEAVKTGKKNVCEGLKGIVDGLHRTGNIGNFDGSISGPGTLHACFRDVSLSPDLTKLSLKLEASAAAELDTSFKFTPLDVAGHVLCQFPWTADKRIRAKAPAQTISLDVSLTKSSGSSEYAGELKATPIQLHFEPSPTALILQNINFHLACPATATLINGMTLGLAPLLPEVLKDYVHTIDPIKFSIDPQIPDQPLLERKIAPVLSDTPKALVVSGEVRP